MVNKGTLMSEFFFRYDKIIFREMMSHPVLFSHQAPKKIAIIGDEDDSILHEVLKHASLHEVLHIKKNHSFLQEYDKKVKFIFDEPNLWISKLVPNSYDIIISLVEPAGDYLRSYYTILNKKGILLQQSDSPFQINTLKTLAQNLQTAGFHDLKMIKFPQPSYLTGWRSALMAVKQGNFMRVKEKEIYNKLFKTEYYNFDMHHAATALPEFLRKEWIL